VTQRLRPPKLSTGCNLWKNRKWFKKTVTPHIATKGTETDVTGCQGIYEHMQAAVSKLRYLVVVLTLFVDDYAGLLNQSRCKGTSISARSRWQRYICSAHRRLSGLLREAHAIKSDAIRRSAYFRNLNHCATTISVLGQMQTSRRLPPSLHQQVVLALARRIPISRCWLGNGAMSASKSACLLNASMCMYWDTQDNALYLCVH